MVIGGLFMAAYLYQGAYGLLIPGCLLLGLGLGAIGKRVMPGAVDFDALGLGVGFVGIYVIALASAGRSHWWPFIPGLALMIAGLASGHTGFERLLAQGWPLILVLLGLVLLVKTVGVKGR